MSPLKDMARGPHTLELLKELSKAPSLIFVHNRYLINICEMNECHIHLCTLPQFLHSALNTVRTR